MTDHRAFGERVKFYRERRGLHQWQLAELLNRSEDWVHRVEAGRIPVNNVKMLMDLADALRVHLEDLQGAPTLLEDQGDHKASRARLRLDGARAYGEAGRTDEAVDNLKRAYRTAPEQIRAREFARDLARRLHKRTHRRDIQDLAIGLGAIK
ncbi:multiprotein-bridging factor 1 family protein [Streptomyces sp. NPDC020379]|uniref:multiprotein-bridging factor 1 family protein n=1 Tax=Streptomyces sp. NPDC020379 TaxID=3365071 RepID=UPI0037B46EC2